MRVIDLLCSNRFLRHNIVFFAGSMGVGFLNYLYYPILGRMLTPGSFGEVQTLVSIFLQLCIFLTVLSLVIVNIVTNTADEKKRNELIFEFERLALFISIILLALSFFFRTQLQHFLQFSSAWPFVLLALCMVVTVPFTLRGALLRGKQRFGLMSAGNIIAAGAKIVCSALLVAGGLQTAGAIGGIVIAQLIACIFVAAWAFRLGLRRTPGGWLRLPDLRLLRPELVYGIFVLLGSLAITLQYSLDIVIVKHYFDSHVAGLYAGIASVARIIFFLTASISQVLISSVRMHHLPRQNIALLARSVAMLLMLGLPALLLLCTTPDMIVRLLMGASFETMAGLLPKLSIAIFIISIVNLLTAYYLALRRYGIALVNVLGFLLTYVLIIWHHGTLSGVVDGMFYGSLLTLGLIGIWIASIQLRGTPYGKQKAGINRDSGIQRGRKSASTLRGTVQAHQKTRDIRL